MTENLRPAELAFEKTEKVLLCVGDVGVAPAWLVSMMPSKYSF